MTIRLTDRVDALLTGSPLSPDRAGFLTLFSGTGTLSGWQVCDGSAISRTTYSELFAVIGTAFGIGDGSTTFNVPLLTIDIDGVTRSYYIKLYTDDTDLSISLGNLTVGGYGVFGAGSVTIPSVGFIDDADGSGTGLYRVAANSLGFTANGVNVGQYASTGAWTLGPSSRDVNHAINGRRLTLQADSSDSGNARIFLNIGDATTNGATFANLNASLAAVGEDTGTTPVIYFQADVATASGVTTRPIFQWNNYNTPVGSVAASGSWTLGSSAATNQTHTMQGKTVIFKLAATGAGDVATIDFYSNSLARARILTDNSAGLTFYKSDLSTSVGGFTDTGAWTLGLNSSVTKIPGTRTSAGAAIVGSPITQSKSLPANNSTTTFTIATTGFQTTGGGALCFVTEGVGNKSVLFFVAGNGATTTITIISQTDAGYYVVGAPGAANKIGITCANGGSAELTLTAGSSGFVATSVWLSCMTNAT